MAEAPTNGSPPEALKKELLYHFCRLQLPVVKLPSPAFDRHLQRCFDLSQAKRVKAGLGGSWESYLDNLYAVDWFLCCGCLEGQARAWELLFAARASRADCLLVDALRARAVRLFPARRGAAGTAPSPSSGATSWPGEKSGSLPILARYDGQRPLVPWLIRVFQNKHVSDLRQAQAVSNRCPKTTSIRPTCRWRTRATAAGTRSSARPRDNG